MRSTINHKSAWLSRQAAILLAVAAIGVRADDVDPTIAAFLARQDTLLQRSNAILAEADTAGRELTAQERGEITDNNTEFNRLETEIGLRREVQAQHDRMSAPQARATPANSSEPAAAAAAAGGQAQAAAGSRQTTPVVQTTNLHSSGTRAARHGTGGFTSFGAFAQAVRAASRNPGGMDTRLAAALTTYGNESSGSDGGFAVPTDYRNEIIRLAMMDEESLFSRCDTSPTAGNSVTLVTDETTPWSTSGVRVYTRSEAQQMQQSKPKLGDLTVKLHETYAFVPVTDELLDDAPMLSSHLTTKAGEAFAFKLSDYILNGTGVGQMLGILNAPALVTVSKETSQVAGTIHADNIVKMWTRMPASVRNRAVWLINQDVEAQLMQLGSVVKTAQGTAVGGIPSYLPPGGLTGQPYGTLLGRPVIPNEAAAAVGTKGDITLAFLGGYFAPYKGGAGQAGIKSDVSMHLFFDQGVTAFRWTMRVGGQPWISAPIQRKGNNGNTLSHFVALENR